MLPVPKTESRPLQWFLVVLFAAWFLFWLSGCGMAATYYPKPRPDTPPVYFRTAGRLVYWWSEPDCGGWFVYRTFEWFWHPKYGWWRG